MGFRNIIGKLPNDCAAAFVSLKDIEVLIIIKSLPVAPSTRGKVGTAAVVVDNLGCGFNQLDPVRVGIVDKWTRRYPIAFEEARDVTGMDFFFLLEVCLIPEDAKVQQAAKTSERSCEFFLVNFGDLVLVK